MQFIFKVVIVVIFTLGSTALEMAHADGWRGGDWENQGNWGAI